MTETELRKYDIVEHLRTSEEMALYLEACIEESDSDPAFIVSALGDIARAHGMAELAREAGLSRESLHKALSANGNPRLDMVLKVVLPICLGPVTMMRCLGGSDNRDSSLL